MNSSTNFLPLRLVIPILALYVVITATGLYNHELFLDEAQHFLLGRDSSSLSSLYHNTRYDGHPRLWNALLFAITHCISASYAGMQIFHLLITTTSVFVFLRFAPFSLAPKLLILSGYYLLFEYNLLSRNYALGILLLFSACCLMREPRKHLLWIGTLILLMCNTHLFYTFAAMGIFFYLVPVFYADRRLLSTRFILFSMFCVAGLVMAIVQFQTPADENMFSYKPAEWLSGHNLSFAVDGVVRGWLPVPQVREGHIWNSYWLSGGRLGGIIWGLLFIILLVFPVLTLGKDRRSAAFYYISLVPFLFFLAVTKFEASRYYGMVFIYYLAARWLHEDRVRQGTSKPAMAPMAGFLRVGYYSILVLQALIGVFFWVSDLRRPFSQSRNAAEFLQRNHLSEGPIAVDGYIAGPMLSAYLDRKLYYMDIDEAGSFCVWKKAHFPPTRRTIEDEFAGSTVIPGWKDFTLVSNRQLDSFRIRDLRVTGNGSGTDHFQLQPLASFQNGIIGWECFFIYKVSRRGELARR